jgi:uncharacterized membrane protein
MWSKRIAIIAAVVACFGLIDSGYLTIKHLQGAYVRCDDECSAVLGSKYADGMAGVPLAGFGAIAYLCAIVAAILAACGSTQARKAFMFLAAGMALFSVWLIYLQAFVIHAFCKYCLASAATCFTLLALAIIERIIRGRNGSREAQK